MPPTLLGETSAVDPPGAPESVNIDYVPQPGLAAIALSNFFLNLITLWFYRFWAKTRVRRHIWSSVQINGEPVEYTGTGKELFLGFIVIMAIVFVPLTLIGFGLAFHYGPESPALVVFQLAIGLMLVTLYGFAIYRARRYRLSQDGLARYSRRTAGICPDLQWQVFCHFVAEPDNPRMVHPCDEPGIGGTHQQ